ncbi:MAG: Ig-like domain-containing protein [Ginsengibacter sp.]
MKTFFVILFLYLLDSAQASNYYFSSGSGDDSRTATQAKNPATPWKTLTKLNSIFSTLIAGDSVLLKRGETFYGSITVTKSGTSIAPIVIGAYGSGSKPVVSSFVALNNWVSKGNGIWESYYSSLGSTVNIVLLNDVQQQLGRYPNADAIDGGYLYFESHIGNTSITDNQLTSTINWTGAELVLRRRRWFLDRDLITSHVGTTIKYIAATASEPYDNYGYFIQNDIRTLDKFGEWYYSASTKKISIYFGSNSPSSYHIEATAINNLISANNFSNIVFDNLTVKGANEYSFLLQGGSNIYIKNCDILFSGRSSVESKGHANFKIENCDISGSNGMGIDLGYGQYAIARNNRITNTAVIAGMGFKGEPNSNAIISNGLGNIVEYNEVRNTGYTPIFFVQGDYTTIKNNIIDSFCLNLDDGGAIYTVDDSLNIRKGRKITGNFISNGIGAPDGTDNRGIRPAEGIYIDVSASNVEITNNTIFKVNRGLYLHNANNIIANNNTMYNNNGQLYIKQNPSTDPIRSNVITNNILCAKTLSQSSLYIISGADDINLFGRFDSNYYARPLNDRLLISNNYTKSTGVKVTQYLDLEGWKDKYNKDGASKGAPKQIAPYKLNKLIGLNLTIDGTFSALTGISANSCSISLSSSGLLDGTYLKVVPSARASSISTKIGSVTAGKKYILRYTVIGSVDSTMSMGTYLRQNASPYISLTPIQYRKVSVTRNSYEMLFSPSASDPSASVLFKVDDQNDYYIDNIQFYEADAIETNPDDSLRFEFNTTTVTKTIALNGSYVDLKNKSYSNNLVLQPYTSIILIKTSGGSQNAAPTVSISTPVNNANFTAPASVTISAAAADSDGSITKVEFYNGSTLLGTDVTSPYTFTWNNVGAGSYTLTAKATDNSLNVTTSSPVIISVIQNGAPIVAITSPLNNANFKAPASITITATAADAGGSITKVQFYNGTTLLGTDVTSPYTFTWGNVAIGTYTLTAKATDNTSLVTTSSPIKISVNKNHAPSVSIVTPASNASFTTPTAINISANADDVDGTVSRVEFYNGTTLLGSDNTSPYTFTWNNAAVGTYTLTAKAIDNDLLDSTSSPVNISIRQNGAPTVYITDPLNNAVFNAPATILIRAIATDADGSIKKVEFFSGTTLLRTENYAGYSWSWQNVPAGSYVITAKATDNSGLVTTSKSISVTVKNKTSGRMSYANIESLNAVRTDSINLFDFQLSPNPATKYIQLNFEKLQTYKKANLSIISLSGSILKTIPFVPSNNKIKLDISSLMPGMYIMRVSNENYMVTKKFIKLN